MTDSRDDIMEDIIASSETIQRLWRAHFFSVLNGLDGLTITPAQLMALRAVRDHQVINSRKLGGLLHVTPGAVTQLVDSLVTDGYVARHQDEQDRRITNLSLSAKAKNMLAIVDEERRAIFVKVFGALSSDELAAMSSIQEKMIIQLNRLQ